MTVETIGNARVDLEGTVGGNNDVSSRVEAVVDWYGAVDFLEMRFFPTPAVGSHDAANSAESQLLGGPIQDNPELAATASPLTPAAGSRLTGSHDQAVPHRVLGHGARLDEVQEIVGAARLGSGPRQTVAAKRLTADHGTGDSPVDVDVGTAGIESESSSTRAETMAKRRRGRRTPTVRTTPAIATSSSASRSTIRRSGAAGS